MPRTVCRECGAVEYARGFCRSHYDRLYSHGLLETKLLRGHDLERFFSFVEINGNCWLWSGSLDRRTGYGNFTMKGRSKHCHRAAYLLLVGSVPPGLQVLHTCDVRHCVNPQHLYLGTHADNMRDKIQRSRQARGESLSRALKAGWAKRRERIHASITI